MEVEHPAVGDVVCAKDQERKRKQKMFIRASMKSWREVYWRRHILTALFATELFKSEANEWLSAVDVHANGFFVRGDVVRLSSVSSLLMTWRVGRLQKSSLDRTCHTYQHVEAYVISRAHIGSREDSGCSPF